MFNRDQMRGEMVLFGPCPMAPGPCQAIDILLSNSEDKCNTDPCMQHGLCISRNGTYECHCTARYGGKNCEFEQGDPCERAPCKNGGICTEDERGNYKCTCATGFTGVHCQTEISLHPLCANQPCQHNGTCFVLNGPGTSSSPKVQCDCEPGFAGARCEIDLNECDAQPCMNGGRCVDLINSFECNCAGTGYAGQLCQTNVDECTLVNACLNGGRCFDTYGSYTCECMPGYGGIRCEHMLNECAAEPCAQGATCMDLHGGRFQCICPHGFNGTYCEIGPPCANDCGPDAECVAGKCVCKQDASGKCTNN